MKYAIRGYVEYFFTPDKVLGKFKVNKEVNNLIDTGCGYGTFLIPASKFVSGSVIGIDVDESMINHVNREVSKEYTISEIKKYESRINYITLFNILNCKNPGL